MLIFLELPPRKMYPDYYQVILKPIDMGMIEAKIKNRQVRELPCPWVKDEDSSPHKFL